ncbi:MAG: amidohydrolase [Candidatus Krumholzibacteriia bacterium]
MATPRPFDLADLRRRLHALAEVSGREETTAAFVAEALASLHPGELLTGLGGHGIAAVFSGPGPGPTVMLRAELDALPIPETLDLDHASFSPGVAHKCGHDGHMTILLGAAQRLAARPPACGRCVLVFQPAEETGEGAAALLADPRFGALHPDWIFALHNLPGYPEGSLLLRDGPFAAGSAGVAIGLTGRTSHAAYPEQGRSPDRAVARLILDLINLPDRWRGSGRLALVTIVHTRIGERAFGITPGEAEVLATVRSDDDGVLAALKEGAREVAAAAAADHGLSCSVEFSEEFPVTTNDPRAVGIVAAAAAALHLEVIEPEESPFRWSEDFGHLAALGRGAMIGLGAGTGHPVLHAPDFDFNDALLPVGVGLLDTVTRELLGRAR